LREVLLNQREVGLPHQDKSAYKKPQPHNKPIHPQEEVGRDLCVERGEGNLKANTM